MLTLKQLTAAAAMAATFILSYVGSAAVHAQSDVQVDSSDGLLTIKANNISASELAEKLSDELGISVVVTGDAETRVNLDIVEEPVERALGKLSPNNMLVHDEKAQEIIEVVLMMGEGQSSGGSSEQFLPSGSPAEAVVSEQPPVQALQQEPVDPGSLRDPNRVAQAREAAGAARSDANLPNPANEGQQAPIDPATGQPVQQ